MDGFSLETPEQVSRSLGRPGQSAAAGQRLEAGHSGRTVRGQPGLAAALRGVGEGVAPESARSRLCPQPAG